MSGTGVKIDFFQSCGHCWVFQTRWHIDCNTLIESSFRIWNSFAGVLPPPLALQAAVLPKAHLISHSKISGSRWVTTPWWLLRPFLYSSSEYSCHLFLISSASIRSLPFLSFIVPIFARNVPLISPVCLKRSLVFPFCCFPLFLYILHWRRPSCLFLLFCGTLHSVGYTFNFLPCFSLLFFPQIFVSPPQTTTLPPCISFSLGWFWSVSPVQYYEPLSKVLQALCPPDLIPWINSSHAWCKMQWQGP